MRPARRAPALPFMRVFAHFDGRLCQPCPRSCSGATRRCWHAPWRLRGRRVGAYAQAPPTAPPAQRTAAGRHQPARRAARQLPAQPPAPTALSRPARRPSAARPSPSRPAAAGQFAGPFVTAIMLCFEKQGGSPVDRSQHLPLLHPATVAAAVGRPWVPYDERSNRRSLGDFKRLWAHELPRRPGRSRSATSAISNGVIGKVVVYNMEERQRVKIVDYVGIEEGRPVEDRREAERRRASHPARLVHRSGPHPPRRAASSATCYAEKGYQFAEVKPEIKPSRGRPEAGERHVPHHRRAEGPHPRDRVRRQQGDRATATLRTPDEGEQGQAARCSFDRRAAAPTRKRSSKRTPRTSCEYYRDQGYIRAQRRAARVEDPRRLEGHARPAGSSCASRSPKASAYKVGNFKFEGNTVAKAEGAAAAVQDREASIYSEKEIRKGIEKAQEVYGARRLLRSSPAIPTCAPRDRRTRPRTASAGRGAAGGIRCTAAGAAGNGPPIVDVTMRMQEGKQYFVNRITFVGNTTTRDNVMRREMRLVESRRVQHRGAEVQRQAPQSARLLQDRSKATRSQGREDRRAPTTRSTSRSSSRSRTGTS